MNVLSLFDGMSCGQIALSKVGINVDNYYASEVDKYAIKIAKKNYGLTHHIGDVRDVKGKDLPKIDLLLGGSPCQGFSYAGNRLNFEHPQSKLFFEFVRIMKECNPKYFLLENVRMKQEAQDIISEYLGVQPIAINSNLVSAQNRYRLYWTNIPFHGQPVDRGIMLKDILEDYGNIGSEHFYSDKAFTVTANIHKGVPYNYFDDTRANLEPSSNGLILAGHAELNGHDCLKRVYDPEGKAPTLNACTGGNREPKVACGSSKGRKIVNGKRVDRTGTSIAGESVQYLEVRKDDKTNCLTTVTHDNLITYGLEKGSRTEKSKVKGRWRKLTPLECERLQTVPDNYTEGVSNSQRYKMLGNGWTVDVIAHIFQGLLVEHGQKPVNHQDFEIEPKQHELLL